MNKYPLKRILSVRELREDQAARELRVKMAELETAIAAREAREAEARECKLATRRKEDELVAAAVGKRMETGHARAFRREIEAFRRRAEEAEAAVEAAAKVVEAARAASEQARARYQARMKDKHKLVNHQETWQAQAVKEAEAAEDKEMEEAASGRKDPKAAAGRGGAE
ncbi:MAG TPA: YscO family type III secretion system apparatus protein [Fibrobacteria bacterium]|nr:YscO family type III secretion system apparatus protein [Fibrobacteria bacterium]